MHRSHGSQGTDVVLCDPPSLQTGRRAVALELENHGVGVDDILTRDDFSGSGTPRLPAIRDQFERAPEPKELVLLDGDAHAQFIFDTDQGERLMQEILRFLSAS